MSLLSKINLYARAAAAQRSLNLRGLPLIPKSFCAEPLGNRASFNQFVLWIQSLRLSNIIQVVDVGANHGDFAHAASSLYPDARVLLVEPLATLHPELKRRCARRNGRWRLEPCALGSKSGIGTLHVDPNSDFIGSLVGFGEEYLKVNPRAREAQSLTCDIRTLDELCVERGIEAIDLLKIDVEGFEFETLRGGVRMLRATTALIIEVSLVRRGDRQNALKEMLEIISEAGFYMVACHPSLYSLDEKWLPVEFNILARRLSL